MKVISTSVADVGGSGQLLLLRSVLSALFRCPAVAIAYSYMEKIHLLLYCFLHSHLDKIFHRENFYLTIYHHIMFKSSCFRRKFKETLKKLWCCVGGKATPQNISFTNSLGWLIYIINTVDKTKLSCFRRVRLREKVTDVKD